MSSVLLNFTLDDENYSIPFSQIDYYHSYFMKYALVYGTAIGACIITAFTQYICSSKKTSPIFILNQLCLLFMVIRSSLFVAYLRGPFGTMSYSVLFEGDFDHFRAYQTTVAATAIQIPLVTCVQLLLIYQVFTVFKAQKSQQIKYILVGILSSFAVAVVGIYIYATVAFADQQKVYYQPTHEADSYSSWVDNLPFILFSASVLMSCSIFMLKLIMAIRTRRILGLKQFSTFHILVIMCGQTMIIPSILLIIGFTTDSSYTPTIGLLITVLSLPLSSMWAFSLNNHLLPTSSALSLITRTSSGSSGKTQFTDRTLSIFEKNSGAEFEKGSPTSDSRLEETTFSEIAYGMQLERTSDLESM